MATPLDSLTTYIATDLGLGTVGTNVFDTSMPDKQDGSYDTAICVVATPGQAPDLAFGGNTDYPGFLVLSRSLSVDTATTSIYTVFTGLHGLHEALIHGVYFNLIAAVNSAPMDMGRDERQRYMLSWAFRSMTRGVTR